MWVSVEKGDESKRYKVQPWEWNRADLREIPSIKMKHCGIVLGWVECLYHSSNNIQSIISVNIPGFEEPNKSTCLYFLLVFAFGTVYTAGNSLQVQTAQQLIQVSRFSAYISIA